MINRHRLSGGGQGRTRKGVSRGSLSCVRKRKGPTDPGRRSSTKHHVTSWTGSWNSTASETQGPELIVMHLCRFLHGDKRSM